MAIGTLSCFVIDVGDLEVGAAFWSEVTGIPRISSPWPVDRLAYLGYARPLIDWAVMQDPFGNEFCLVRPLTRLEREALAVAAEQGPAEDAHWRAIARNARGG